MIPVVGPRQERLDSCSILIDGVLLGFLSIVFIYVFNFLETNLASLDRKYHHCHVAVPCSEGNRGALLNA